MICDKCGEDVIYVEQYHDQYSDEVMLLCRRCLVDAAEA